METSLNSESSSALSGWLHVKTLYICLVLHKGTDYASHYFLACLYCYVTMILVSNDDILSVSVS